MVCLTLEVADDMLETSEVEETKFVEYVRRRLAKKKWCVVQEWLSRGHGAEAEKGRRPDAAVKGCRDSVDCGLLILGK